MARERRQTPRFESLEGKLLLSTVHFDHIVAGHAGVAIRGTVNLDVAHDTSANNANGSQTGTIPVSGRLAGFGPVGGSWVETVASSASNLDSITLTNARGSVTATFTTSQTLSAHAASKTMTVYTYAASFTGTGAYANQSSTGILTLHSSTTATKDFVVLTSKP